MSYDRWGHTPEEVRRERVRDWLCVLALGLMVACVCAIAALAVVVIGA